jgi:predicted phosphodiesterase
VLLIEIQWSDEAYEHKSYQPVRTGIMFNMRIAFLSDIHANLPALEAVLADVDLRQPDAVYCLGDLVSYAPWPNEVIQMVRRHRIPTLLGNHDDQLGRMNPLDRLPLEATQTAAAQSLAFTHAEIGSAEREFLRNLPRHIRLEFVTAQGRTDVLMVHGSPTSLTEYLLESRSEAEIDAAMNQAGADVLLFGHSHLPYHKRWVKRPVGNPVFRHAINTGSVGKPKDGDPRAGYVVIEWESPESDLNVQLVRVAYDVERTARAIEQSPLPDEFADRLRKAY